MRPDKIPIVVLTGFLGSGKTMLLNALLRNPRLADSAVVVNEFGEIGLDHLLVSSAEDNIVLLDAGCLCCAVMGSLKETLADLHHRRSTADLPPFSRVLVETSGLADPGPILQSIMRDSLVSHFYRLAGLVCVVDALHGMEQLDDHSEARAQTAYADRLLISKTDLTGDACPAPLLERLKALNPAAEIRPVRFGEVEPEAVLGGPDSAEPGAPWLGRIGRHDHDHGQDPGHHHGAGEDHHDGLHDPSIRSESFFVEPQATWAGLAAWTQVMRLKHGRRLLRCKGLVNVQGQGGPVVLHGVQGLFDTRRLESWPDEERRSRLVLIGHDLDRTALAESLDWLGVPEGVQPPLNPDTPPPAAEPAVSYSA